MTTNRELLNSLSNEEIAEIIFHDDIKNMASDGYVEKLTVEMIVKWLEENIC